MRVGDRVVVDNIIDSSGQNRYQEFIGKTGVIVPMDDDYAARREEQQYGQTCVVQMDEYLPGVTKWAYCAKTRLRGKTYIAFFVSELKYALDQMKCEV